MSLEKIENVKLRIAYPAGLKERFGVDVDQWRAIIDGVFPSAENPESIMLALAYCKARNLDIMKKCVHIVAMWNDGQKKMIDAIMPGICELRTTAARTGNYAGIDEAVFGKTIKERVGSLEISYPEWAQVTVYRLVGGVRCPFVGSKVYWKESYAVKGKGDLTPNKMWAKRPFGQLEKCAEAAALRKAFPEEIGNDYIPEEVSDAHLQDVTSHGVAIKKAAMEQIESKPDLAGIDEFLQVAKDQVAIKKQEPEPEFEEVFEVEKKQERLFIISPFGENLKIGDGGLSPADLIQLLKAWNTEQKQEFIQLNESILSRLYVLLEAAKLKNGADSIRKMHKTMLENNGVLS